LIQGVNIFNEFKASSALFFFPISKLSLEKRAKKLLNKSLSFYDRNFPMRARYVECGCVEGGLTAAQGRHLKAGNTSLCFKDTRDRYS